MRRVMMMAAAALALSLSLARAADEGKTYKVDDEGFIRNWLVLDPITLDENASTHEESAQKDYFAKEYFKGQKEAKPAEKEKVKVNDKELTWRAAQAEEYYVDFEKTAAESGIEKDNALFLGAVYIIADQDMNDVKLSIGSDDSSVWTLNGKEVIRVYSGRPVDKDQDSAEKLTLKKGVNVLSFAVINGTGPTGAAARFLNAQGEPIKTVQVSLTPPRGVAQ
jgi:hypothetical protein